MNSPFSAHEHTFLLIFDELDKFDRNKNSKIFIFIILITILINQIYINNAKTENLKVKQEKF